MVALAEGVLGVADGEERLLEVSAFEGGEVVEEDVIGRRAAVVAGGELATEPEPEEEAEGLGQCVGVVVCDGAGIGGVPEPGGGGAGPCAGGQAVDAREADDGNEAVALDVDAAVMVLEPAEEAEGRPEAGGGGGEVGEEDLVAAGVVEELVERVEGEESADGPEASPWK